MSALLSTTEVKLKRPLQSKLFPSPPFCVK
jgi:hypothetical protein